MKIPKRFQLAGITWQVLETDALTEAGVCDSETAQIRIRASLPRQVREATFCHELVHALKFTSGDIGPHDEKEVDAIGNLLHQFLTSAK